MLIRLCGHYLNNPNHIDKLISIKGLPDEWFFRPCKYGGKELIQPWEPDVEENIPQSIRHLCEPTEVTKVFPPIEKGKDSVIDKFTILGVRFNFMSNPGQELWEKIERYLERMTPRDERIPAPVLVAPNHTSMFNPHSVRKTVRGSIELIKADIPDVDLRKPYIEPVVAKVEIQPSVAATALSIVPNHNQTPQPVVDRIFKCNCGKQFNKEQGLRMHKTKAHSKQPAGV